MAFEEINGELDIHRRFGALTEKFAVAKTGVPVAQHQECAALEDRQVRNGAFVHAIVVEIAPCGPMGPVEIACPSGGATPTQPMGTICICCSGEGRWGSTTRWDELRRIQGFSFFLLAFTFSS